MHCRKWSYRGRDWRYTRNGSIRLYIYDPFFPSRLYNLHYYWYSIERKKRFKSEVSNFTNINKTNNYISAQINEYKKYDVFLWNPGQWIETDKQYGTVQQVNEIPILFIFFNWISNGNAHINKHLSFHSHWLHNICLMGSLGLLLSL
jgi:hypothetical protein